MRRPCECGRASPGPYSPDQCRACWLAVNDPRYALLWGLQTPDGTLPPARRTSRPRPEGRLPHLTRTEEDCPHLGAVVEYCHGCGGGRRHVRRCEHPGNPEERCTVGHVRGSPYWECETCEHHPSRQRQELTVRSPLPPPPVRWAYGVTTVPERYGDLLPATLRSLTNAGFDRPVLFADGLSNAEAASWEKGFGLEVVARPTRVRTWGNFVLALQELFVRDPSAERFAMFQDDVQFVRNLRGYLDRVRLPDRVYWNLFTVPRNQALAEGKQGFFRASQRGWGALALVFSRQGVIDLLSSPHAVERPLDAKRGHKSIDGGIVTALTKAGYEEWCHSPSLVQHTGAEASSMGNRQAPMPETFPGEGYDALELLKKG